MLRWASSAIRRPCPWLDDGHPLLLVAQAEADAQHIQVVDLPGIAGPTQVVVDGHRITLADDLGAHDDFTGVVRTLDDPAELDRLVAYLRERRRVLAHQHDLELVLEPGALVRRRLTPGRLAGSELGHGVEVHVRQDLGVDQREDALGVATLDGLVGLMESSTSVDTCLTRPSGVCATVWASATPCARPRATRLSDRN
nr:hypothetical protein [Methylibium sp. T29-B]